MKRKSKENEVRKSSRIVLVLARFSLCIWRYFRRTQSNSCGSVTSSYGEHEVFSILSDQPVPGGTILFYWPGQTKRNVFVWSAFCPQSHTFVQIYTEETDRFVEMEWQISAQQKERSPSWKEDHLLGRCRLHPRRIAVSMNFRHLNGKRSRILNKQGAYLFLIVFPRFPPTYLVPSSLGQETSLREPQSHGVSCTGQGWEEEWQGV